MAWACNLTRWGGLEKRPWPSFSEHNLLKRQKNQSKSSQRSWETAGSFPFILPSLIFLKIRKVGKCCNALRKTFKQVKKISYHGSPQVYHSLGMVQWTRGKAHYEMVLLGFYPKTTSPCGKPSETLSNAWEPSHHRYFQSETWKWRNTTGFQSSSWLTPILPSCWSQKKRWYYHCHGNLHFDSLVIKPPAGNILLLSLIAAHDLLLLLEQEALLRYLGAREPQTSTLELASFPLWQTARHFAPWFSVAPVK